MNNKGITGVDITIAIIIIITFTGVIASLMFSIYNTSLNIQKGANADAYATMILEKVDEKSYDEVDENFIQMLKDDNEIEISDDYVTELTIEPYTDYQYELIKKVNLIIKYTVNKEEKTLNITKLKIKEMGE
jgi:hypothetical protein